MSGPSPLASHRDAAAEARRRLEREIAQADEMWRDSGRRAFDAAHLTAIRHDARSLEAGMAALAEQCQLALTALGED